MKKTTLFFIAFAFCCTLSYSQVKNNNTLLWRISSSNTDSPSYLFGTIHLPQKRFINYSDSVYAAIQKTSVFYNEVDFLHMMMFGDTSMMSFFMEKTRQFDSIQKTTGWKRVIDKINRKYNKHISYDSSEQFLEFSQDFMKSTYEPEEGVQLPDMMLAAHATMLGKQTGGLETFKLQINMIYEILEARIRDTTMEMEDEMELTEGLKKFYIDEKLDSISALVEKINTTYRKLVFDDRNKTMADSMEKHIGERSSFFAVGAGHLGGRYGVIEMLRKKGFTVTPVHSDNKISMLIINDMMKMSGKFMKEKKDKWMDESKIDVDTTELQEGIKIDVVQEPPPQPPPQIEMKKAPVTKPVKQKPKKKPAL